MPFLNDQERKTLYYICDTLIPSLEPSGGDDPVLFRASADDINLPNLMEIAYERITTREERRKIKFLLRALNNGLFNGLIAGHWSPIKDMPLPIREDLLFKLATSRHELARTGFLTFKRLAAFLFYSVREGDQPNPTWSALRYSTPPPVDPEPDPIRPHVIDKPTTLETEVLVIGSGAGGGVVAGLLAQAGHEMIVVEKGDYYADHQMPNDELTSMNTMYEKRGALMSEDSTIAIMAGSTLGGGTTVNWTASFRTPDYVLREWEQVLGFSGATGQALQDSFDAVIARTNINTDESTANPNNQKLDAGCAALGYTSEVVPRNVKGCEVCDFCNYGCQFGAKQSTTKTYLRDAYDAGAKIIVRGHVDRILHDGGTVRGAVVTVTDSDGITHNVTIKAKVVVLGAGSIHTPAIMLRSGLNNPNIGANLRLHPTTVTTGLYDDEIFPWRGAPLTRVVIDFKNLDGNGYGVWLENAPAHPGLNGQASPWTGARQHKRVVQQLPHTGNIIILTRDRDGGQVSVNRYGQPTVKYRLSKYDAAHLLFGLKESVKIHAAAGAREVASPHNDRPVFHASTGANGALDHYLASLDRRGLRPNDFALFSAHQMSSARIGGDAARGAVDPTGQSWEVRGLYVADGSALPNAPGVNPMLSIMAVAHYIAGHIASRL
ncbi:MAG: hypothetical protein EA396_09585 [Anaerolineaceae bacterium]|nr:MAG: hypothetical protein EA396_09585 [Anaerolineaceae bacterium]